MKGGHFCLDCSQPVERMPVRGAQWPKRCEPHRAARRQQKALDRNRRYFALHGDRKRAYAQRQSVETRLLYQARHRAKKSGRPCTITEADIHVPAVCPVLGMPLKRGTGFRLPSSPTIDRIDPSLGYVPDNIQVISFRANVMKHDASPEELILFANWVHSKFGS